MHTRAAQRLADVSLQAIGHVEEQVLAGRAADFALKRFLHHHRELGGRDRRFISGLVFSYLRWWGWLTRISSEHLSRCLYAWWLDAGASHSAADALFTMAGMPLPDMTNPMADKTVEEKLLLFATHFPGHATFSVSDLVPSWFHDALYTPPDTESMSHGHRHIEAFQSRPPTWLRFATSREEVCLDELAQRGLELKRHPSLRHAAHAKGPFSLGSIHAARHGDLEIQDLASQCVGLLCAPQPGESWWDVCAGSGGKSLHMADLMQDQGHVRGTDIRPGILKEFARRIQKTRFTCISTELLTDDTDGSGALYDGVLLDAPCSGVGTWSRNPDARWRTPPDAPACHAETQRRLLDCAARAVRPGGRLVYSVCTLTREETTDMIKSFLDHHGDFSLEPVRHPLDDTLLEGLVWVWPWQGPCDGMFIAVLRRR